MHEASGVADVPAVPRVPAGARVEPPAVAESMSDAEPARAASGQAATLPTAGSRAVARSPAARSAARWLPGLTPHAALALAAFALGVALRAMNLGGPAFCCDEFYDVFAARSVLAGEGLQIPGRPYTRAWLATYLTAGAFALLGAPIGPDTPEGQWASEAIARLPALVFGVLTLGLVYVAGRALFGPTAGLVALSLLAVSPHGVDIARFARLYSPLTFFVLVAALAAFRGLQGEGGEGPRLTRRRVGWLVLGAGAGLVAVHLHPVALGLVLVVQAYTAALALWLVLQGHRGPAARYAALAVGFLLLEALGVAIPDVRARLVQTALTPLPWYRPTPGDALLYHNHLAARYAWLWYLLWPATLVVVLTRSRAGLFVALAFWVPFVVVSGAVATRHPRYVVHLLPFAWLLLGGAAGALWPAARAALSSRLDALLPSWIPQGAAAAAVLAAAAAPVVRLTPSVVEAVRRPWQATGSFTTGHVDDWRGLARALGPQLEPEASIVASTWHAPRYYLGRPTYHLLAAFRRRGAGDWEMPTRRAEEQVQRAEHLAALRGRGVPLWVVVQRTRWERADYIDAGLKRMIARECRAVPLPPKLAFVVFACGRLEDGIP